MKDDEYYEVLKSCRLVSTDESWYDEGTECTVSMVWEFFDSDMKFKDGMAACYNGLGSSLESCQLSEFQIYDKDGIEISDMTLNEYLSYLNRNEVIRNLIEEGEKSGICEDFNPDEFLKSIKSEYFK